MSLKRRYGMRRHDWASLVAVAGVVFFVVALARGDAFWATGWGLITFAAGMAARRWSRRYPGPMPYALRWTLFLVPHAPEQLKQMLEPASGERMLEIGPGVGHHALPIASALAPNGVLDVLDLQQEMLDAVVRRATAAGVANIVAKQGEAHNLPYPDGTFDGAYLSAVLGEIPDQARALQELRRVLRTNGRLVIVEGFLDPDYVPLSTLREAARRAGFVFERKRGPGFAYMARFRAGEVPIS